MLHALPSASQTVRPARPPWPDQCAVRRLARAWRRGGAVQDAPSCAAARRTRALTLSWPRPAPVGAPCRAIAQSRCRRVSRYNNRPGRACWPDLLHRRQESPVQTRHAPAPVQVSKGVAEGTFFLVRTLWVRPGGRRQRVMPAAPPGAGARPRLPEGTSCCCAAVFCCCTRPVNCRLRISNLSV